jgi:Kef-type K+ transport system membrane component KefB
MAAAAFDDVASWITLAVALAVISSSGLSGVASTMVLTGVVVAVAFAVRQLLARADPHREPGAAVLPITVALLVGAAVATAAIGLHEIFGAFLAGLVVPRGRVAEHLRRRIEPAATLLLPAFFVVTGLRVELRGIGTDALWWFALILAASCAGKVLGAGAGARLGGLPRREALAIGVLMNARGLTELIVVNVGLETGVIGRTLFSLLTLMAVLTTVATGPLLERIRPDVELREGRDAR